MGRDPKVSIIILNYINWHDTVECLESILQNDYRNIQIIVVDNDSPNNAAHFIQKWATGDLMLLPPPDNPLNNLSHPPCKKPVPLITYTSDEAANGGDPEKEHIISGATGNETSSAVSGPVILIRNRANSGFAGGINLALGMLNRRNDAEYVWLLNPDVVIEQDSLTRILQSNYGPGSIVGCHIKKYSCPSETLFYGGAKIISATGTVSFARQRENCHELDFISGGCLFTHIDNFRLVGYLPDDYFLYWEDADWCWRAKKQGLTLITCVDAVCYDKTSSVIGKGYTSDYYYTLGALIFFSKYSPRHIKHISLLNVFRVLKRLVMGKFDNAKAIRDAFVSYSEKKRRGISIDHI